MSPPGPSRTCEVSNFCGATGERAQCDNAIDFGPWALLQPSRVRAEQRMRRDALGLCFARGDQAGDFEGLPRLVIGLLFCWLTAFVAARTRSTKNCVAELSDRFFNVMIATLCRV